MPEQAEEQAIAASRSSQLRPVVALNEASDAALAVDGGTEAKDRDEGWGAGAGLAQPKPRSSESALTAVVKSLTLPGRPVHNSYAPAVTRA